MRADRQRSVTDRVYKIKEQAFVEEFYYFHSIFSTILLQNSKTMLVTRITMRNIISRRILESLEIVMI